MKQTFSKRGPGIGQDLNSSPWKSVASHTTSFAAEMPFVQTNGIFLQVVLK